MLNITVSWRVALLSGTWKDNAENRGMRVNMNKTKVMVSGEWQKVT